MRQKFSKRRPLRPTLLSGHQEDESIIFIIFYNYACGQASVSCFLSLWKGKRECRWHRPWTTGSRFLFSFQREKRKRNWASARLGLYCRVNVWWLGPEGQIEDLHQTNVHTDKTQLLTLRKHTHNLLSFFVPFVFFLLTAHHYFSFKLPILKVGGNRRKEDKERHQHKPTCARSKRTQERRSNDHGWSIANAFLCSPRPCWCGQLMENERKSFVIRVCIGSWERASCALRTLRWRAARSLNNCHADPCHWSSWKHSIWRVIRERKRVRRRVPSQWHHLQWQCSSPTTLSFLLFNPPISYNNKMKRKRTSSRWRKHNSLIGHLLMSPKGLANQWCFPFIDDVLSFFYILY